MLRCVCFPLGVLWGRWLLVQLPQFHRRRPVWDCLGDPVYRWPIMLPSGEIDFSYLFCIWGNLQSIVSSAVFPSLIMFVSPSIEKLFYLRFLLRPLKFVWFESFPSRQDLSEGDTAVRPHTGHPVLKSCKLSPKEPEMSFLLFHYKQNNLFS